MAAAEARVSRVRVRTLDTTPRPRRYRWRMPAWMEAAAVIVGGTALLWGLYVGMWAVVGK